MSSNVTRPHSSRSIFAPPAASEHVEQPAQYTTSLSSSDQGGRSYLLHHRTVSSSSNQANTIRKSNYKRIFKSFMAASPASASLAPALRGALPCSLSPVPSASLPLPHEQLPKEDEASLLSHDDSRPATVAHAYEALQGLFPEIYKRRREANSSAISKDSATLPHRMPLRRRFADQRWKESRRDKRFTYGTHCIDRFKDIPPVMILKWYHHGVILEGQDTIYPLSSPMVQEWLNWIDDGRIHPDLISLLSDFQIQYYDGCIVIEIHDYRYIPSQRWPFSAAAAHARGNEGPASSAAPSSQGPEIHRMLLKPNEASFMADMEILMDEIYGPNEWNDVAYLQVEAKLRVSLSAPLCLEPTTQVTRLLNFSHYQGGKCKKYRGDPYERAKAYRELEEANRNKKRRADGSAAADASDMGFFGISDALKFKDIAIVEDIRRTKSMLDQEPFSGLDTRKTLFPSRKPLWNIPLQKIYRTVRLERDPPSPPMTFSLNIIVSQDGAPEAILRIGSAMDTSEGGETLRFRLGRPQLIESYIQSFKALVVIQDSRMKCVTDLTNPSAWNLFFLPKQAMAEMARPNAHG